jgi:hypothetical protein
MGLRREEFGEEIASSQFVFQLSDGSKRPVHLRVGKPYMISTIEWACPVELNGFESRYPDIRGGGSIQTLSLALELVWRRLQDFLEKDGKVLDAEDGSVYTLEDLRTLLGR